MSGPPRVPPIPLPTWLTAAPAPAPAPAPAAPPAAPAVVELRYNDGVTVKGTQEFVDKTKAALDKIKTTATGASLLDSLAASGQQTTIVHTTEGNSQRPDEWKKALPAGAELKWMSGGTEHKITGEGGGSGSTVKFNPDKVVIGNGSEDWMTRPPDIGLAHELIHADDTAHGNMDPNKPAGSTVANYERQAVGLDPFTGKEHTENKIRAEWDAPLPARPRY